MKRKIRSNALIGIDLILINVSLCVYRIIRTAIPEASGH